MTTSYLESLTTEDLTHLLQCLEDSLVSTRILLEYKRKSVVEEFEIRYDSAYIAELETRRLSRFVKELSALSASINSLSPHVLTAAYTILQNAIGSQAVTSVPAQSTLSHNSSDIPTEPEPRTPYE